MVCRRQQPYNSTLTCRVMQATLHHIPDEVLDAAPKQLGMTDWQPSNDMPCPPTKRRRSNGSHSGQALLMQKQAEEAEMLPNSEQQHPEGDKRHVDEQLQEDSMQAQDEVLLERGDCAASAPVAA